MRITIRQEVTSDFAAVFDLIAEAFSTELLSDHQEQFLVERLRRSNAFIPELSLVAEDGSQVVGHILLTKLQIRNNDKVFDSLALAPVSVHPDYQKRGIGALLIGRAHQMAKELGYQSIVVLGHENYYPKFGYQPCAHFGIELPFDVPPGNCMAIELVNGGLKGISGMVDYPGEFYE